MISSIIIIIIITITITTTVTIVTITITINITITITINVIIYPYLALFSNMLIQIRLSKDIRAYNKRAPTPSPPTKSSDSRGFDSSRLLILRGGNSHVR